MYALSIASLYDSGWWNTWFVEATKTVAKYENGGEPRRTRLNYHTSNAHCALLTYVKESV